MKPSKLLIYVAPRCDKVSDGRMHRVRRIGCVLAAVACSGIFTTARASSPLEKTQVIPASDPRFRYDGRFDLSDPRSPVVIWEASTISIDFQGSTLETCFSGIKGQVFFNATVDGVTSVLAFREGKPEAPVTIPINGAGLHHLVLFKRTEATAGTAHFTGIQIGPGSSAFAPTAPTHRMKMEFIGDSILAGACDEDGPKDQWDDRSTHDAAVSWAAVTAAAFSADYQNISVSGIGVATGFVDVFAGEIWDKVYPVASSPKANLGAWTPDVVLVLLGDNDDSYPRSRNLPFPTDFVAKYAALVHSVRAAYPKGSIVLLNGAMWAGIHSEVLGNAWNAAVSSLESTDSGISHFVFAHWTPDHPRIKDHRALADELDAWLKVQPFMTRFSGPGGTR